MRNMPIVFPAQEGVIQLACRKMVENFRLYPRVFDRIYQSAIGTPGRISERFLLQTKAIAHFRQPLTEKANWITRSKAGAYRSAARAHPRWLGISTALEVRSGGGMGPGFPPGKRGGNLPIAYSSANSDALRV